MCDKPFQCACKKRLNISCMGAHLRLVGLCGLHVCNPSEEKLRQVKNANWAPCCWLFPLNLAQKREKVPSALLALPKAIADLWVRVAMPSVAQPARIVEEKFHFDSGFQENKKKKGRQAHFSLFLYGLSPAVICSE